MSYDKEVKILTLGNSKVGKSSYIIRYTDDDFNMNINTTIGIDYKYKIETFEDKKTKVMIYDTNGQERWRSISFNVLKNAQGVLLFFDVSDRESFDSIKIWFESIYQHKDENFPIVLIGNKIDLPDRAVTKEEGEAEAQKYGKKYFETSCKDGIGINEPLLHLLSILPKEENESEQKNRNGSILNTKGDKKKTKKNCC